jgi:hypothetical protein
VEPVSTEPAEVETTGAVGRPSALTPEMPVQPRVIRPAPLQKSGCSTRVYAVLSGAEVRVHSCRTG